MTKLAILVGVVGAATAANAQVVFDNFGGGNSYNTGSGWTISGAGSPIGHKNDQGDQFTPSVGGMVGLVEFAAGLVVGTNSITIDLMTDAAGQPGAIMKSWTFNGMGGFGNNNPPNAIVNGDPAATLVANTPYWLIASVPNDNWSAWNQNSIGDVGLHAFRQDNGAWNVGDNTRGAFRVTLIPAPASMALVGLGGLIAGRRRRA